MPLKRFKKPPVKRKQNGKKVTKAKQKSEMETPAKEQLSELEKEILVIQINELEGKLKRKMHMCSYMEEETSIYRALYGGKRFLKSESMKLLNEAFQDFASEIFLLDQEYRAMQSVYSSLARRQHFCLEYQKRVDMLNALGTQLEENLLESEKCFDELPVFTETFASLEEKAATEKAKYDCLREEILKNFDGCLLSIQNEVHFKTGDVVRDTDLKLSLLPFSWQALFCSGWLSRSWLDSSSAHLEYLQSENGEMENKQDDLLQFEMGVRDLICDREKPALPEQGTPEEAVRDSELRRLCLHLETQNVHQQNKLKSMRSEMVDLEKATRSLEVSGESYFDKSYLIQIVHKAGGLLKREFEGDRRTPI